MRSRFKDSRILIVFGILALSLALRWILPSQNPGPAGTATAEAADDASVEVDSNSGAKPNIPARSKTTAPVEEHKLAENLRTVLAYRSKVLYSDQERSEYHAILSDPQLIQASEERLRTFDLESEKIFENKNQGSISHGLISGDIPTAGELERMQSIDVFRAALAWKENPRRTEVQESMLRILSSPINVEAGEESTERMRDSFIGDRIELYALYQQHFPSKLEELNAAASAAGESETIAMASRFVANGFRLN